MTNFPCALVNLARAAAKRRSAKHASADITAGYVAVGSMVAKDLQEDRQPRHW